MAQIDPFFYVLGFLDEYMGRGTFLRPPDVVPEDEEFVAYIPDESVVESFYLNELLKPELFAAWLARLAAERGIGEPITSETTQSGHIRIHCRALAELINQSYTLRNSVGDRVELFVSKDMFPEGGVREKLSFLAGAYARYGADHALTFTNARHKSELAMAFLRELGCDRVRLSSNPPDYIPLIDTLSFEPTEELAAFLACGEARP